MGELKDFANKISKYLMLGDKESVEVIFQGFKFGENPYNTEEKTVFYSFGISQDGENVTKILKSRAQRTMRDLDPIPIGSKVKITRYGTGPRDTEYKIEKI